ncbi:hypothetical protein J7443_10715 [Tropicibacter sp. R15_0]|uniref:DUF6428 family protein n=1 Tax=Tropicibacter sp. R15_0 TaxID=2821101 RepID=UPI001ADB577F|nr:DUF6428 family protein [Tropicibacter sp. R15_0]MBO9465701.1 hypothetical protein [Tropicibacter sp. R15_0]
MTLTSFLTDLEQFDPDQKLIFATEQGVIGAGYHVTELRHSLSTGIDCGGQIETWEEARLQLLDGAGPAHMRIGKFLQILRQSLKALPQLANVPVKVEFSHENRNMQVFSMQIPRAQEGHVVVNLTTHAAACKPMQRSMLHKPADKGCYAAASCC